MAKIRELLERSPVLAVVGMSRSLEKAAGEVPAEMIEAGFRVIPVNPHATEILGRRAYAKLEDVPEPVDMVVVFRPSGQTPEVARSAVAVGAKALWLQLGIASNESRAIAEAGGLDYVEDHCIGVERRRHGVTQRMA